MNLNELVDSLIELSCHEMPEEARKSLDDAIDNIVSSMTELQLQNIVEESFGKMVGEEEEIQAIKSMMEGNIAIA